MRDLPTDILEEFAEDYPADNPAVTADYMIGKCENLKLGWSLDHTGGLIEARIWNWPTVIGRYRPVQIEPLPKMLWMALQDGNQHLKNGTTAYA